MLGAYPLLEGETRWFLAAGFDKRSWKEDTAAFAETCRSVDAPTEIGVPARGTARTLGFLHGTRLREYRATLG